ncbi:MAG: 16S rRNA (guanine(966)-N(2))-methyltransferase RsmD [Firmicutes bacterium]|nr:16S rRNA (guanine(966)-N(2))-methyltransferase RsmD [Bacillota bacterium]MBQ9708091.1 16S rRNA (guanine(966)-N(2))-methyltransferase RsmD [Bacillota bacterium]
MRVIAGEYKGRRLESPKDDSVRPTTDKAKEALFSILTNDIWGARVLDLFAGTGSLGIEALSRGASECVFADQSRESIRIIKNNIAHCGAGEKSVVVTGDFRRVLMSQRKPFDIILLDPPYGKGMMEDCFRLIGENQLLSDGGLIVAEHRREETLPDEFHGYKKVKERRYGIVMLSIYGCTAGAEVL